MPKFCIAKLKSTVGSAVFVGMICGSFAAGADVIADRKAKFKATSAAMKSINAALRASDFDMVVKQAKTIVTWAQVMPNHFPEGSDQGDTKARAEIWLDFDAFKSHAMDNEKAALALISMAETGDMSATIGALKSLGGTCKSCHSKFKE